MPPVKLKISTASTINVTTTYTRSRCRMKATSDIDGVILAGTELPLILLDPIHNGIPFLDTTKIHVEAAVTQMLL